MQVKGISLNELRGQSWQSGHLRQLFCAGPSLSIPGVLVGLALVVLRIARHFAALTIGGLGEKRIYYLENLLNTQPTWGQARGLGSAFIGVRMGA